MISPQSTVTFLTQKYPVLAGVNTLSATAHSDQWFLVSLYCFIFDDKMPGEYMNT